MTKSTVSQPAAQTFSVVDLVTEAQRGRIRIPQFQRRFRWQREDARRLLDSIVRGYPIGNLLFWKRKVEAARVTLGALEIIAGAFDEGWLVVDGQQRLTSLANAFSPTGLRDARFALAYDLKAKEFVDFEIDSGPPDFQVPLPTLYDLTGLVEWFASRSEVRDSLNEAAQVTKALREYRVPVYLVENDDEAILRDIFDRLNNYGKRLSRAEVFSALHPGETVNEEPWSQFDRIAERVDGETRFGRIDDDTVLRAVLARRGADVTRDIRSEFSARAAADREFGGESRADAYREGALALQRAVQFLQGDVSVPRFEFLAYRYLLVVLTRFFAHFPDPHPRNRALLRRWYWRAALIGPGVFSTSWTEAMRALAGRIQPGDEAGSVQRLLEPPIDKPPPTVNLRRFRTNTAAGRMVMCALWDLKPRSPETGKVYTLPELANALEDRGAAHTAVKMVRERDGRRGWAANRVLILDDDETEGLNRGEAATRADPNDQAQVLASHTLDAELVALWETSPDAFLDKREKLLDTAVSGFLKRMAESDLEDTPPLDSLDLDESEDDERDDNAE